MIGRPRHGDMLVKSTSAETTRIAPTAAARSRIRLSSQSGQSPTVCGGPALTTAQLIAIADNTTGDSGRENLSLSRRPVRHDSQAGCSEWEQVITPEHSRGSPPRKRAVLLALGYYGRQMARLRRFAVPAMLLPALGNTCIFYIAP